MSVKKQERKPYWLLMDQNGEKSVTKLRAREIWKGKRRRRGWWRGEFRWFEFSVFFRNWTGDNLHLHTYFNSKQQQRQKQKSLQVQGINTWCHDWSGSILCFFFWWGRVLFYMISTMQWVTSWNKNIRSSTAFCVSIDYHGLLITIFFFFFFLRLYILISRGLKTRF